MLMKMPAFVRWVASKDGLDYCVYNMKGDKHCIEVKEGPYVYGVFGESHEAAAAEFVAWYTRGKPRSSQVEKFEEDLS